MDDQQEPAVQHRELCPVLCGSLDGRGILGGMDTCIYMAESLCSLPEITATLLISYIPIQNKKVSLKMCTLLLK